MLDVTFEDPLTCWMSDLRIPSVAGCQFLASLHFIGCHAVLILVNIVSLPTFSRFGVYCLFKLS